MLTTLLCGIVKYITFSSNFPLNILHCDAVTETESHLFINSSNFFLKMMANVIKTLFKLTIIYLTTFTSKDLDQININIIKTSYPLPSHSNMNSKAKRAHYGSCLHIRITNSPKVQLDATPFEGALSMSCQENGHPGSE